MWLTELWQTDALLDESTEMISIDSYHLGGNRGRVQAAHKKKVKIYINPKPHELVHLRNTSTHRIRFVIGTDDNLYLWTGHGAIHFDILHHAGIEEKYGGYINPGEILLRPDQSVREMAPLLRSNSHILDVMGGAAFRVARNTDDIDDF